MVVDTLGLVWALCVTPASVQDRDGAKLALEAFRESVKFPKVIWADTAYRSIVVWALVKWLWVVEIRGSRRNAGSSNARSAGSIVHADWPRVSSGPPKATPPSSSLL